MRRGWLRQALARAWTILRIRGERATRERVDRDMLRSRARFWAELRDGQHEAEVRRLQRQS
jgi:hypothetical protein